MASEAHHPMCVCLPDRCDCALIAAVLREARNAIPHESGCSMLDDDCYCFRAVAVEALGTLGDFCRFP